MAHLIAAQLEPFDLGSYTEQLQLAHDHLARCGAVAVKRACDIRSVREWGAGFKRVRVTLPDADRPRLVSKAVSGHNLVEVVNQCATLERLLDVLRWCLTDASGLRALRGERCHPTTSSVADDTDESSDNDLVLIGPDGSRARFEVSDVASSKDGNCKEGKELARLGVLRQVKRGQFTFDGIVWPANQRVFLVVSSEFAERLERPARDWLKGEPPHCRYIARKADGSTRIFEVCRGM